MKNTILPLVTAFALTSVSQAGVESAKGGYSAKAMPEIAAPSCLWSWFAGGSAGYLSGDWDDEIYTLHFGAERKCNGSDASHAVFLEVGYSDKGLSFDNNNSSTSLVAVSRETFDYDVEIIPITLNYKYEQALSRNLSWYAGAGAGVAIYDVSVTSNLRAGSQSQDDTVFYAHIFAGIIYNVSESFEVFAVARYVFMDDPDFFTGFSSLEDQFTPDGDIHIELGARFNF